MNDKEKRTFLSTEKLEKYVTKKRDEINLETRKINREESVMKKRKEKMNSTFQEIDEICQGEFHVNEGRLKLKDKLLTLDFDKKLSTITKIRKMLSIEKNPPIQEILDSDVLPVLIQFIQEEKELQLKFEIAWIITNIASGTSEQTMELIKCGTIPILIELIQGNNENLSSQCVWALGNIAGDSSRCREYLLNTNLLGILLAQINSNKNISFLRNATWTLSNLCREKPGLKNIGYSEVILTLGRLVFSEDSDILTDVCWALSYISDGSVDIIEGILNSGMLHRITELLMHSDTRVQTPALRTIGNIVTGNDSQTQAVINCSALPCLLTLLNSNKKSIKREACWAISNITAGNVSQIQAAIDCKIFPILIKLLESSEMDVKKEAAWAIANATTGGTSEQIDYLIKCNPIPSLIKLLESTDERIIKVILEGLENILETGEKMKLAHGKNLYVSPIGQAGGLEKIENLQQHPDDTIYESAVRILERFFDAQEETSSELESEIKSTGLPVSDIQIPECKFNLGL